MKRLKHIVGKNTRFVLDYLQFVKFFKKQKLQIINNHNDNEHRICIVVLPWIGTAVPWYAITLALLLNTKGKNVFILLDDMPFGDDELFHKMQAKLIHRVLQKLNIPWAKLSKYNSSKNIDSVVEYLSQLNSLHYTKGETNKELRNEYEKKITKQLSNIYTKLDIFFQSEILSQMILPGGIWGSSGIFSFFAKKQNVQLTTYDCGESILLLSIFGVAAQLKDIPHSYNEILKNPEEKLYAIQKGREQLDKRRNGQDMYQHFSNNNSQGEISGKYYLMLLNSVWDSAALGLHTVYESMIEWILDSTEWVINNTDKTIVIRQHPAERAEHINNTDSYETQIKKRFGKNNRIIFIEAKNDVNTYNLIEKSLCILGFSSTSVVESVALGKPAIIVSNTYYAEFGIVYNANNKDEYYDFLEKASNDKLEVTQEMVDRASISNYITQSCNWYKTDFTPNRNNFLKWSEKSIDELDTNYLPLQAILENTPISLLQHKENKNAN